MYKISNVCEIKTVSFPVCGVLFWVLLCWTCSLRSLCLLIHWKGCVIIQWFIGWFECLYILLRWTWMNTWCCWFTQFMLLSGHLAGGNSFEQVMFMFSLVGFLFASLLWLPLDVCLFYCCFIGYCSVDAILL